MLESTLHHRPRFVSQFRYHKTIKVIVWVVAIVGGTTACSVSKVSIKTTTHLKNTKQILPVCLADSRQIDFKYNRLEPSFGNDESNLHSFFRFVLLHTETSFFPYLQLQETKRSAILLLS